MHSKEKYQETEIVSEKISFAMTYLKVRIFVRVDPQFFMHMLMAIGSC